jgi:hypothetical protein
MSRAEPTGRDSMPPWKPVRAVRSALSPSIGHSHGSGIQSDDRTPISRKGANFRPETDGCVGQGSHTAPRGRRDCRPLPAASDM